ncbi:MAG: putative bifunctional diguanylate cyclase/phosphodiesterase [Pseudomonadota bacterium]
MTEEKRKATAVPLSDHQIGLFGHETRPQWLGDMAVPASHYNDIATLAGELARGALSGCILDISAACEKNPEGLARLAKAARRSGAALILALRKEQAALLDGAIEEGIAGYVLVDDPPALRMAALRLALARRDGAGRASASAAPLHWTWHQSGDVIVLSEALMQTLGLESAPGDLKLDDVIGLIHPQDRTASLAAMRRTLSRQRESRLSLRARRRDGHYVPIRMAVRVIHDANGDATGLAATLALPGEASGQSATADFIDPVTGLGNLAAARAAIDHMLASKTNKASGCAVICVSVSRFDHLNIMIGRPEADRLLGSIAHRLTVAMKRNALREARLCRLGGADFALIMAGPVSEAKASTLAKALVKALQAPFKLKNGHQFLSVRAGISLAQTDDADGAQLLRQANAALSEARESAAGTVRFYSPRYIADHSAHAALEQQLRHAMDRHELAVHYHPMLDLATRRIVGFEALVRWPHPERGLLSPPSFLSIAEQAGLIADLSDWVLRSALGEAAQWRGNGCPAPTLSVNISASQFRRPDMLARLLAMVESASFDPRRLILELTETMVMEDIERSAHLMQQIKGHGIRIAIDDFGTGYSALSYLKYLPFSVLKVDRMFIEDLPASRSGLAMLEAIIAMAKTMDMAVIAEGVEATEQLECLARAGCDMVQGYLFSPPLPASRIDAYLVEQTRA